MRSTTTPPIAPPAEAQATTALGDPTAVEGTQPPAISRRNVLLGGLALLPGILGARALSGFAPADVVPRQAALPEPATEAAIAPAAAYDPTQHAWGFVCDTTTCIGCGHCMVACKAENKVPTDYEHNRTWIELHVATDDGVIHVAAPDGGIHGAEPELASSLAGGKQVRSAYFVPRLCMQCENPPCVNVCPVSATYRNPDGVTLVDEQRCIGCGFCLVACPYGARYLVPNTSQAPKGVAGVADKCTFCYHRITKGMQPACVEVCPVEARVFGDLNDPNSQVNAVLHSKRTQILKPALGTKPRVHYVGLENEVG